MNQNLPVTLPALNLLFCLLHVLKFKGFKHHNRNHLFPDSEKPVAEMEAEICPICHCSHSPSAVHQSKIGKKKDRSCKMGKGEELITFSGLKIAKI